MKKLLSLVLALVMIMSVSAFAAPVGVANVEAPDEKGENTVSTDESAESQSKLLADDNLGTLIWSEDFEDLDAGTEYNGKTYTITNNFDARLPETIEVATDYRYITAVDGVYLPVVADSDGNKAVAVNFLAGKNAVLKFNVWHSSSDKTAAVTIDGQTFNYYDLGQFTIKYDYKLQDCTSTTVNPYQIAFNNFESYHQNGSNISVALANRNTWLNRNLPFNASTGTANNSAAKNVLNQAIGGYVSASSGADGVFYFDNIEIYYKPNLEVVNVSVTADGQDLSTAGTKYFSDGIFTFTTAKDIGVTAENFVAEVLGGNTDFSAQGVTKDGNTYTVYATKNLRGKTLSFEKVDGSSYTFNFTPAVAMFDASEKPGENVVVNGYFANPYLLSEMSTDKSRVTFSIDSKGLKVTPVISVQYLTVYANAAFKDNTDYLVDIGVKYDEFPTAVSSLSDFASFTSSLSIHAPYLNGSLGLPTTEKNNWTWKGYNTLSGLTNAAPKVIYPDSTSSYLSKEQISKAVLSVLDSAATGYSTSAARTIDLQSYNLNAYKNTSGTNVTLSSYEGIHYYITHISAKELYSVSIDTAAGTGTYDKAVYATGEPFVFPTAPTRTGFDFAGWDYNGSLYNAGDTVVPTCNGDDALAIAAIWKADIALSFGNTVTIKTVTSDTFELPSTDADNKRISYFVLDDGNTFTEYETGKVYTTADFGGKKLFAVYTDDITSMRTASIRTTSPSGIRFKAIITNELKGYSAEYGFIAALKETFNDGNGGYDYSDFVINSTKGRVLKGVSYNKAEGIDKIYAIGEDFGNLEFTAVLHGIPAEQFDTLFAVRPYMIDEDGFSYYGDVIEGSVNSVANALGIDPGTLVSGN